MASIGPLDVLPDAQVGAPPLEEAITTHLTDIPQEVMLFDIMFRLPPQSLGQLRLIGGAISQHANNHQLWEALCWAAEPSLVRTGSESFQARFALNFDIRFLKMQKPLEDDSRDVRLAKDAAAAAAKVRFVRLRGEEHKWCNHRLTKLEHCYGQLTMAIKCKVRALPRRNGLHVEENLSDRTRKWLEMNADAAQFEDPSVKKYAMKTFVSKQAKSASEQCLSEMQIYASQSMKTACRGAEFDADHNPYLLCIVDYSIDRAFIVYELGGRYLSNACRLDADDDAYTHLSERELLLMLKHLVEAVAHLHRHGIVHQDLGLHQIVWANRSAGQRFYEAAARAASGEDPGLGPGIIKINDFGLAKTGVHPIFKVQELELAGQPSN